MSRPIRRALRRLALTLLPALGLTACEEPGPTTIVWTFDLRENVGEITLRDLRGGEGMLAQLVGAWVQGEMPQTLLPRVTVGERALVVDGDALNLVVPVQFTTRADLPLLAWDDRHPTRFCPPMGQVVTRANAKAHDADGCVIWGRRAKALWVETAMVEPETRPSLLPAYMDWVQAGSPAFGGDEAESPPEVP